MTAPRKRTPPAAKRGPIAEKLLAWYAVHARVLPWRYRKGETADPYRVWLSEIMLQQTTVAAVKAYFQRFTAAWPTVGELAAAPVEDIMREWAGLGYYSRARNLHAAAQMVVARFGGVFPADEAALRELPGVGRYTAAAVAAIAFGLKASPVDGNIERVVARLFAVETPLPAAKPDLAALAETLTPDEDPGHFAQAMMDLGATICTPRNPVCALCPLNEDCKAFRQGIAAQLPRRAAKVARPERFGAAFVAISTDERVLLQRRPPRGLLGGMLETPNSGWAPAGEADPLARAPFKAGWAKAPTAVEHGFTHFQLTLDVYVAHGVDPAKAPGLWVPLAEIDQAGLPTLMRKVVAAASERDRGRRLGGGGGRRR